MNRKRFSTESELITLIGGAAREVLSSELAGKADGEVLVGENSELRTSNRAYRAVTSTAMPT